MTTDAPGLAGHAPGAAAELAASATDEWAALVATAVLGTDRRPPPAPLPGWDTWARSDDPAIAVLDRSIAVVAARRCGARPSPAPDAPLVPAPADLRPPCPPACATRLVRILAGEHDLLLAEWFDRCEAAAVQLPWVSLPTLLMRGRRHPLLDQAVRRLSNGRASWLAEIVPELGIKVAAAAVPVSAAPFARPNTLPDSAAAVSSIVGLFLDGQATWAAAPQLRLIVAALDPIWLPGLAVELSRLSFDPVAERTRGELITLAEFRAEMIREFERHSGGIASSHETSGDLP